MTIAVLPGKSHISRLQDRQRRRIKICLPAGKTLPVPSCCAKAQEVHHVQLCRVFRKVGFRAASRGNGQVDDKEASLMPSFFSLENLQLDQIRSPHSLSLSDAVGLIESWNSRNSMEAGLGMPLVSSTLSDMSSLFDSFRRRRALLGHTDQPCSN